MKKSKRSKRKPKKRGIGLFLFFLIVAFAASTGASYFYLKERFVFKSSFIADIEARQDMAAKQGREKGSLRLYGGSGLKQDDQDSVVLRKDTLLVVAENIIRKYVKPYRVRLLDLYMDKEGVIYIDFGGELIKNFNGDALEELRIIAGLYEGIKSTVPGFTALKILIEGREAESFGGHIDILKPIGGEIAGTIR
ncbi:MAG TPA: hypothetical protein ENG83_01435 [Nitrospirae bacterium]|nr:hypothetical protein BMS3Abin06_02454 [bacterium BMS3Abin06]HDH10862.1 hypothetical protein [Nitrospirota bacterium]HDZ02273.1 hypothetical protein [Nitrospirota bacterium]